MTTVAMLGAGFMGTAMAARLGEQGHDVRLWNRTAARARTAAEGVDGVTAFEDLGAMLEGAEVVITMLTDGDAVQAVAEQALPLMGHRAVWVQASTVGIDAADRLRAMAELAHRPMLDAPVSGTTTPARQGKLTWLVSGPDDALAVARPVLDALGSKVVHLGHAQEGSRTKLVINLWMCAATVSMADTLLTADLLQVPREAFLGAIDGGPLAMPYAATKAAMMSAHDYPAGFPVELALKDVDLALSASGGITDLLQAVADRLRSTTQSGRGREDVAAIAESPTTS